MIRSVPMLLLFACETTATIGNLHDAGGPCRPVHVTGGATGCTSATEFCALASDPEEDHCIAPGETGIGAPCVALDECEAGAQCATLDVATGLVDVEARPDASYCRAVCARDGDPPCTPPETCRSVRTPDDDVRVDYGVCVL